MDRVDGRTSDVINQQRQIHKKLMEIQHEEIDQIIKRVV